MAILSEPDGAEWHRLAGIVARSAASQVGPGVVAPRAKATASGWEMAPLAPALRAARRAARVVASAAPVVVRTDIRAFYPSVSPATIHGALAPADRSAATRAAEMLDAWGSEGYAGLPIGPPASAVVADVVLRRADLALGAPFLRWVDDYLIACRSERHAVEVLDRLDEALDALGLQRSEVKTELLDGRSLRWPGGSGVA